jgi:putative ABC transport system permease protein
VINLNLRVLAATVAISVATAIFFGLVPVLGGLRRDLNESLKSGGREHSGFRRAQIRNVLIVCEVAVSLVLLAGAGVLMRSFLHEREAHLGFNPQRLLTADIYLTKANRTVAQQARFRGELTTALQRLPGVLGVATTSDLTPFAGASTEFATSNNAHSGQSEGQFALIDSSLFRVLGVPLVRGRNLSEGDIVQNRMVAVVNQALAEKFFRGQDPLGKRIQVTTLAHLPQPISNPWVEIVGVAANFRNRGVRQPVIPEAFIPYTLSGFGGFSLVLQTVGEPQAFAKRVESTALTLDSSAIVRHARSMQEALEDEEYAKPRFGLEIFSVFAVLGLLLVSAGLYGVMSYTVSQQRREMGIRVALGATSRNVQALVIGKGMRFVAAGILAGLLLSLVLLRFIQNQVWDVSTHDPVTLTGVVGILVVVGIVACYAPSIAATHVDPAETLRSE